MPVVPEVAITKLDPGMPDLPAEAASGNAPAKTEISVNFTSERCHSGLESLINHSMSFVLTSDSTWIRGKSAGNRKTSHEASISPAIATTRDSCDWLYRATRVFWGEAVRVDAGHVKLIVRVWPIIDAF